MSETVKATETAKEKVKVSKAQVKAWLKEGLSREEIGERYGLNRANRIRMFQDPELKGLKSKQKPSVFNSFVFEDEAESKDKAETKTEDKTEAKAAPSDGTVKDAVKEPAKAAAGDNW